MSGLILRKTKKLSKLLMLFRKTLDESLREPNIICVDKGSEFCNKSIKFWLQDNDIEIHLTHNERKSVVAKRLVRTLKNKIYKYMTSASKKCILIN